MSPETRIQQRKPRYRIDFRDLMLLCEQNYVRLLRLLPRLSHHDVQHFRLAAGENAPRVSVRVLERCRYTTILRFEQSGGHDLVPNAVMTVRLYHDAHVAEVTEALPHRRVRARYAYPNRHMHQEDEKLQWNGFLAEWLRHIAEHGLSEPAHVAPAG